MSFSLKVKEELKSVYGKARHCQIAELAAIVHFAGKTRNELCKIDIPVENDYASGKAFTLLQKTFTMDAVGKSAISAIKLKTDERGMYMLKEPADSILLRNPCCRRAFLRGAFLSVGSVSNPQRGYHLELVCEDEGQAEQLIEVMGSFGIEAHRTVRKKYTVVYIKEGEAIVNLLNIMGAHASLMDLENMRILKEISNDVNRRVNCETANITKTVNAASRQLEDIIYIRDNYGLGYLPERLREIAEIRLENPDATLKELGEMLEPQVGKSGVNHRLRKLSELADELR